MFDKLIESRSGAELRPRRRYFVISSVVVGILFVTAVVASLYAADIGLGVDEFEIAMVMAPVTPDRPEPVQQSTQRSSAPETADVPHRQFNQLPIDELPLIPDSISTTPNAHLSRPDMPFRVGPGIETNKIGSQGSDTAPGNAEGTSSSAGSPEPVRPSEPEPEPPPLRKPEPPKAPVSIGVANGKAIHLPKPPYPAPALAIGAQGKVDVQVTIDEEGKVISAKAANGHPLLRQAAERAAWNARFTPTTLSKIPVKVTGVIVYNFTRN